MKVYNAGVAALALMLVSALICSGCSAGKPRADSGLEREGRDATGAETASAAISAAQSDPIARGLLRERALHVLATAAGSGDAELRANAIEALQAAPTRLSPIAVRSAQDPNTAVRAVTAMAVARARACSASGTITPLLNDSSPMVRAAALFALRRCGQNVDLTPLADMLKTGEAGERMQAAFVLGELGEKSATALLREAARERVPRATPAQQRILDLQIAEARVKLGDDEALADIRTALYPARPEDLEATALAVKMVGDVGDRGSMDQLVYLTAMKDGRKNPLPPEVRLGAAGAMAKLGNRQGTFIADQYRASPQASQRAHAAFVYGEIGRVEALGNLERLLKDSAEQVRVSAAYSILRITGQGNTESGRGVAGGGAAGFGGEGG